MNDNFYESALFAAYEELAELKTKELEIAVRRSQLRQTVDALFPLVFPQEIDIKTLSLPAALRLILKSAGRPLSASDFKTKLEDMGFDTDKYDNPLANIHTAMSRMVESEEMAWVNLDGKKKAIPGPDLKPPQFEAPESLPASLTGGGES
jgi:hypothetical protein